MCSALIEAKSRFLSPRKLLSKAGFKLKRHGGVICISAIGLIVNLIWIAQFRVGKLFDIDEAGYLERAIVDGHFLSKSGPIGLYQHLQNGDPQAPLLPVIAGFFHSIIGGPTTWLFGYTQIFYVILIGSVYALVLKLKDLKFALIAALTIAVVPSVLQESRSFQFGLVAAAMMTLALAVQVYAGKFDRWSTTLAWGVALGLASLSRTMVIGLLPGLLVGAMITLLSAPRSKIRFVRASAALLVAFGVAWTWWGASWRAVFHYLNDYGYGRHSGFYGKPNTVFSLEWWTKRPGHIANELGPLLTTLLIGVVVASVFLRLKRRNTDESKAERSHWPSLAQLQRVAQKGWLPVVVALTWDFFALSSTRNEGSYFELTAVPLVVVLSYLAAVAPTRLPRVQLLTAGSFAACLLVATSGPWFSIHPSRLSAPLSGPPLFDGRGTLYMYAQNFYKSFAVANSSKQIDRLFRGESDSINALANEILRISRNNKQPPFLTMAVEEPFVNTNTIQLRVLELTGKEMPVMLVKMPGEIGASIKTQLTSPIYGRPNFVIVGNNKVLGGDKSFLTLTHPLKIIPLLRELGFKRKFSEELLGGQTYQLWWRGN